MNDDQVLKGLLAESKAEFVQANIWTLSDRDNAFVRRWQIDRSQAQAAEEFLRVYLSAENYPDQAKRTVTDPWASGRRDGVYRGGRVMAKLEIDPQSKTEEWFVYQELRKGFVDSLVPDGGSAPAVDWSEFVLLKSSGYHADHEMPVLRLNNVAPAAASDLASYLNQDTFTDVVYRDGTLYGTWRRVEVRSEQEDDGSYHIDVLLTDSANTSLYVRFLENLNVWKGIYHKWDADETTIAELESTIQFNSTGEIVESGGKTLREEVAGRTVQWSPIRRASDTRLFELAAEIVWTSEQTLYDSGRTTSVPGSTLPRTGTPLVSRWFEVGKNTDKLPSKPESIYDAEAGTWVETYDMQSPPEILPNGRYNWVLNCSRTALPAAMLSGGVPRWIRLTMQKDTKKNSQTITQAAQQVQRMMNALFDPPPPEELIPWNDGWDNYVGDGNAPPGWDEPVQWTEYIRKTYRDTYTLTDIAWNPAWDNYIRTASNPASSWDGVYGSINWRNFIFPSAYDRNNHCGAGYAVTIGDVTGLGSPYSLPGGVVFSQLNDLGGYIYSNPAAAALGIGDLVVIGDADYIFMKVDSYSGTSEKFLLIKGTATEYIVGGLDAGMQVKAITGAEAAGVVLRAKYSTRTRGAYVGYSTQIGKNDLFAGVSMASGAYIYHFDNIAFSIGYPYRTYSPTQDSSVSFIPSWTMDGTRKTIGYAPRSGYYENKYSNPNMMEVLRRTKKRTDTIVYRKYCAVHPHMLASTAAFIPEGFIEDDKTWPSDGFWIDSNIKLTFKVSDGAVQMFGAMLYYVECIVEFSGEEQPDVVEQSARAGEGARNFPQVDPETATARIYYRPPEVSTLFGPNTLPDGATREAPTIVGEVSKMIEAFEVREIEGWDNVG